MCVKKLIRRGGGYRRVAAHDEWSIRIFVVMARRPRRSAARTQPGRTSSLRKWQFWPESISSRSTSLPGAVQRPTSSGNPASEPGRHHPASHEAVDGSDRSKRDRRGFRVPPPRSIRVARSRYQVLRFVPSDTGDRKREVHGIACPQSEPERLC